MSLLASQVEQIARIGANIEITSDSGYLGTQIEQIIRIAVRAGAHVKVHASGYLGTQLEQFARIGGSNVTIVV
ncbi:hypothetical protein ACA877_003294 [Vibrio alginolyticus]